MTSELNPPTKIGPDVFQMLAKAAEVGHGITLQPSQVGQVVETLMGLDYQGRQMAGKVEALTRVIFAMLVDRATFDIDTGIVYTPFQMTEEVYEGLDYERGFTLDWDEDTGIITVAIGEATEPEGPAVGLSALPDNDVATENSGSDESPLPETTDQPTEAREPSGADEVGPLDELDESDPA